MSPGLDEPSEYGCVCATLAVQARKRAKLLREFIGLQNPI